MPTVLTLLLCLLVSSFALSLQPLTSVLTATCAQDIKDAACVVPRTMTPPSAGVALDPCHVVTLLKADIIETLLHYFNIFDEWVHVVNSIWCGFETGICKVVERTIISLNHSSSNIDHSFIDTYILSEQTTGCYSCAFDSAELESIIGPFALRLWNCTKTKFHKIISHPRFLLSPS